VLAPAQFNQWLSSQAPGSITTAGTSS